MKSYIKLIFPLSIFLALVICACDDSANQFGGNNPKSGYVELLSNSQIVTSENSVLTLPVELNTSINPNGITISYMVDVITGELPSGFIDASNGVLHINAGEIEGEIEIIIPQSETEYGFSVSLVSVDDSDFSIGLSDNSKVVSTSVFVVSNEPIALTIDENPSQDQVLTTMDKIFGDGTTFSLESESIEGAFSVDSETGELSVLDRLIFDWEINPTLTATVGVALGSSSITKEVVITLNDVTNLWTGPSISFVYEGGGDVTLAENQDRITDLVWFARDVKFPIYNAAIETGFVFGNSYPESVSPEGTLWAVGNISDGVENLSFSTFADIVGSTYAYINSNGNAPLVVYLIKDDVYLELTWIDWHRGNGADGGLGGFSYLRSTPL